MLLVPGGFEDVPKGLPWAAPRGGAWDQCELGTGRRDGILMGSSCGREFKAPAALGVTLTLPGALQGRTGSVELIYSPG